MSVFKWRNVGTRYVSVHGNNLQAGNINNPYKTIAQGVAGTAGGNTIVIGSGVYDFGGLNSANNRTHQGDGNVKIININNILNAGLAGVYNNLELTINGVFSISDTSFVFNDCKLNLLNSITTPANVQILTVGSGFNRCVLLYKNNYIDSANVIGWVYNNCTITLSNYTKTSNVGSATNSIIKASGLITANARFATNTTFSLISNTGQIKFGAQPTINLSTATIQDLRNSAVLAFGGVASDYFSGCIVADPLFNDEANEDYTLQLNSPARFMSSTGSFVGARNVAMKFFADADANTNSFTTSFYQPSAINIQLDQANPNRSLHKFTIFDQFDPAIPTINTKPVYFSKITELGRPFLQAIEAFAIGEVVDSTNDIDFTTPIASGAIQTAMPYYVVGGTITYNGLSITSGSYFAGVAGVTTFTVTSGTPVVYLVIESPNRKNIGIRTSTGRDRKLAGDMLNPNTWYAVYTSTSAVYNGITYPQFTSFLTDSMILTHTGGNVVELFPDNEPFQLAENLYDFRGVQTIGGALTRGNGGQDADYTNDGRVFVRAFQLQVKLQRANGF